MEMEEMEDDKDKVAGTGARGERNGDAVLIGLFFSSVKTSINSSLPLSSSSSSSSLSSSSLSSDDEASCARAAAFNAFGPVLVHRPLACICR